MNAREDGADDDIDVGEPITELADFRERASGDLLGRIRRSLQRRSLGSQLATLSWGGIGTVLQELLEFLFSFIEPRDKRRDEET